MISFKEFVLLKEGPSLFSVPRKLMGVFNNINDMPPRSPYGFWVDTSGNFIPTESHLGTAVEMLTKANKWLVDNNGEPIHFKPKSFTDPYRPLYDQGWIRVVSKPTPFVRYEMNPNGKISDSQIRTLKEIQRKYAKEGIKRDYGSKDILQSF